MKRILFILGFLAIVSSCNSDDDTPQQSNFYALTVGNSWTYKYHKYNYQTDSYDETTVEKTVTIVDTEDIYGNLYYKFKSVVTGNETGNNLLPENGEFISYFRENDGNLINKSGHLIFTNNNYDEIELYTGLFYTIFSKLQNNTEEITVEAGTFDCIYANSYGKNNDTGEIFPATDKYYYKEGIGLIKSTSSYLSSSIPVIEKTLVSYNIH